MPTTSMNGNPSSLVRSHSPGLVPGFLFGPAGSRRGSVQAPEGNRRGIGARHRQVDSLAIQKGPPACRTCFLRSKQRSGINSIGDLNQIHVWITEVHRDNRAHGAGALNRSCDDRDRACGQVAHHLPQWNRGEKTQVRRSGSRVLSCGREFLSMRMQVDLLFAKGERPSSVAKSNDCHAQDSRIELGRGINIVDGQNQVIKAVNSHEVAAA